MRILALDTSTFVASVAIVEDGRVLSERDARVTTHSEMLLPLVAEALGDAGLSPADVDLIACGAGPGSFTGLRIGLATAKGLCLALRKPLVMASSLATLAMEAEAAVAEGRGARAGAEGRGARVLALLDARRRAVYAGLYELRGGLPVPIQPEAVLAPARLAAWVPAAPEPPVVLGDGALAYPDLAAAAGHVLAGARATPRAAHLARLAASRPPDDLATAAPTYVRPPEVE
jgi:tRNA threonylcarbamoyladenosine biosynthesis protein TsaB